MRVGVRSACTSMARACVRRDSPCFRPATKSASCFCGLFAPFQCTAMAQHLSGAFPQSAKARGPAGRSAYMMRELEAFNSCVAHLCDAATRLEYESLGVISCSGEASHCRASCHKPCATVPACTWHSHCNKRVTANVLLPACRERRGRSEGKAGTTGSNRTTSWTRPGNANASYEAAAGP